MSIAIESPSQPDVIRLIEELDAYQTVLYPPESHHGIDVHALSQPNVVFVVARDASGEAVGCGAVVLAEGYGELKRMFVNPRQRGSGVGKSLLKFLENAAIARGCGRMMLETGIYQPEALDLYARAGYARCAPFGGYEPDPMSVFMVKELR